MTDFYIAKQGQTFDGQNYANVVVAAEDADFTAITRTRSTPLVWAAVYNTPDISWNSIRIRQMNAGQTGDLVKLRIYKGSIPNDPNTSADDSEATRAIDENDFVEEATYVRQSNSNETNLMFTFTTTMTKALLGDSYTVVQRNFDADGVTAIASPECRFGTSGNYAAARGSQSNYTKPNDNTSSSQDDGGPGNLYQASTFIPGGTANVGGENHWNHYSSSGDIQDVALTHELYVTTSNPLGNDSNDGLTPSTPKATLDAIIEISDDANSDGDNIFFYGATYTDTELNVSEGSGQVASIDATSKRAHNFLAYLDQEVIFRRGGASDVSYFMKFQNITDSPQTDFKISGIKFRDSDTTIGAGGITAGCLFFVEDNASSSAFPTVTIENCTFEFSATTFSSSVITIDDSGDQGNEIPIVINNCICSSY